jgi:hypothetical protein
MYLRIKVHNSTTDLPDVEWGGMDWIALARAFVNEIMNLEIP